MSSPNQARRVTAQIFFQGADITGSMRPYFLSATYTDKEADGTDDLQLKLHLHLLCAEGQFPQLHRDQGCGRQGGG